MTDRQITHAPGCWGWGPRHYECAVREIERLAVRSGAETSNARGEAEYEYEVWQGDALQAGGREADYASAQSEANHYAAMYAPDGPVEVRIYEKRLLSVVQQPAEQRAQPKRRRYDPLDALHRELAEASEALWAERAEWKSIAEQQPAAVDAGLAQRIQALVGGVEVDLEAPLSAGANATAQTHGAMLRQLEPQLQEQLAESEQPAEEGERDWLADALDEMAGRRLDALEVGREDGLQAEIERLREQLRLATVDQATAEAEANDARAEIEALRAEVAAWRELSDHVRVGACAAIWPDRYTDARTRDVAAALKRAARMEEALRELEEREQSESFLEANDE